VAAKKPITLDVRNANTGTDRGRTLLKRSLQDLGAGRSILTDKAGRIIAGNKTYETWAELADGANIEVVHTNGEKLIVVQRDDLDLSEPNGLARRLAYYDNRVGEVDLAWNLEEILHDVHHDLDFTGLWDDHELSDLLARLQPPPSLDDLTEEYGDDPDNEDFWPVIRIKVSPETHARFEEVMEQMPGETPHQKLAALLDRCRID
jgi:hypothetical protein